MGLLDFIFKKPTKKQIDNSINAFTKLWEITDINKIWVIEDKNDFIIAINGFLCRKCLYGEKTENLSLEELTIYLSQAFESELNNGGFSQFLSNSSGDFTHETLIAIKNIKAYKTSIILENVISIFPNATVPKDRSVRENLLDELCENEDNEEVLSKADNDFYKYDDNLLDLNYNYIIENKYKFI